MHRTKINAVNISGVLQGSILELPLFNMYKWNFFYNIKGLKYASFADDDTPYTCLPDIISVNPSVPGGNKKVRHT